MIIRTQSVMDMVHALPGDSTAVDRDINGATISTYGLSNGLGPVNRSTAELLVIIISD